MSYIQFHSLEYIEKGISQSHLIQLQLLYKWLKFFNYNYELHLLYRIQLQSLGNVPTNQIAIRNQKFQFKNTSVIK